MCAECPPAIRKPKMPVLCFPVCVCVSDHLALSGVKPQLKAMGYLERHGRMDTFSTGWQIGRHKEASK